MAFVVTAGPFRPNHIRGMTELGLADLVVENVGANSDRHKLSLGFVEPRGTGDRRYEIEIERAAFRNLAEAMIRTDREAALKAFGAALQANIFERIDRQNGWRPPTQAIIPPNPNGI